MGFHQAFFKSSLSSIKMRLPLPLSLSLSLFWCPKSSVSAGMFEIFLIKSAYLKWAERLFVLHGQEKPTRHQEKNSS